MASNILRKLSACCCSFELKCTRSRLGQAIDQFGHSRSEALHQSPVGDRTVLEHVVQQGRHQGFGVKTPLGANFRNRDRVADVWVRRCF